MKNSETWDITEPADQNRDKTVSRPAFKATMAETLLTCIRTLTEMGDINTAIEKILEIVCRFHQGTRGYIFELSPDNKLLNNTYEWCAEGVSAQINNLQKIDREVAADWFVNFEEKGSFSISSLESDLDPSSADFRILDAQGIKSLMAVPLMEDRVIRGFIGVDDPRYEIDNVLLLTSVAYFVLNDIQKRRLISELEELSYIDPLTQLYNRNKYIKDLYTLEHNKPESLGVVYVDLNGLKLINDKYGHSYGDQILKKMAELIATVFSYNNIYRIGGDEFIVLYSNCTKEEFEADVLQLRHIMKEAGGITASIGNTWENKGYNINNLIKHADDLMYANKQRYYRDIEDSDYNHGSSLAKQLLGDLMEGHFVVYLQPKISLDNGTLCGAEALIRGIDEEGQLVFPDSFIPIYESHGIIRHVDFFVLETVCKLLHDLTLQGKEIGNVSVNFSRTTLLEYDIVNHMVEICNRYDISPSSITIEVTETTAKLQIEELMELVTKIKEAGFQVSLDDYGSEYSNMAVLSKIGFDEIKLDRSIVSELPSNEKTRTIAQYTIRMLKELEECRVVAEGIETTAELDIVKQYGCEYGQGYHFSRPISIEKFLEKYF